MKINGINQEEKEYWLKVGKKFNGELFFFKTDFAKFGLKDGTTSIISKSLADSLLEATNG